MMEGEKERQLQQQEEKESNEAEDDLRSDDDEEEDGNSERAVLVWQEGYDTDNLGLPIMHWEALSLHIAELEKQEEEKRLKAVTHGSAAASLERIRSPLSRTEDRKKRTESWEDGSDACNSHVLALTSRLQTQMNLQLCFINNSESEGEEEDGEEKKGGACNKKSNTSSKGTSHLQNNPHHQVKSEKPKSRGFRSALRNLRDRLSTDHKTPPATGREPLVQRKHLELDELQTFRVKELNELCASLSKDIQDRSSELVSRLHIRDQLRTEQDAKLLEVQDLMAL
ncbi:schwannomin-interacting protein 1 isoform X2 [Austrofundulus limnaeus]|uniref:Schwannomin-interacting protein 1 isoform X2 n=1 Tax=Austrofundulus limnaeus TaxID=52670 RepID=A0A2I4CB06_AUSLI|nr:PREDICTED: schwannomin-interacting protein 1-like isoform X2 [Austrofundulus limnaeus]